ncbi:MAG: hypothetical protein OHM56_02810 [Spiroplasma phoeniceum]|nr:MAG: hypothetical protein OHM56_02810 [Spiroplasma phoeniceum]
MQTIKLFMNKNINLKLILSLLGSITLIVTSTTNLIACNTPQEYTKEKLDAFKKENQTNTTDETIKNNLEWMAPQEKPFNKVDNKYYYVVWRYNENNKWKITKFSNNLEIKNNKSKIIFKEGDWELSLNKDIPNNLKGDRDVILYLVENKEKIKQKSFIWGKNKDYLKSVYRWNLYTPEPDLIVDKDGVVKVNEYN